MAITKVITPDLIDLKNSQLASGVATTYVVTVVAVTGVGNRYFVNGVQAPNIVLIPGTQYIINQDDASNAVGGSAPHPIVLSTTIGTGGAYSTGVVFSLDGTTVSETVYRTNASFVAATQRRITITLSSPPTTLYYICWYHQNMGNTVITVGGALNTDGVVLPKGTTGPTVDVEYLVVAGGGGGGGKAGGGGGAGGYLSNYGGTKLNVDLATNLIVTIGAGGGGGGLGARGGSGSNSIFSIIDSSGGGGGGYYVNVSGLSGGSGGGGGAGSTPGGSGGSATPSGQGFNGGTGQGVNQSAAGGGGGASEVGVSPSVSGVSADGGDGLQNNIDGNNYFYAGGGGGSANNTYNGAGGNGGGGTGGTNSIQAIAGTDGRGGGGGGGAYDNTGRAGGKGVVIIRYVTSDATLTIGGGLTHSSTTIGSETIVTFTAGSDNISFAGTGIGRPSSPTEGLLRDNTTTGALEFYDGSLWQQISGTLVPDNSPSDNFNTVIWDGDNATSRNITALNFEPDFVWFKSRTLSAYNNLIDSVRGSTERLVSDTTAAQVNQSENGYVSSFSSNGFVLQQGSSSDATYTGWYETNQSGQKYVAWSWKGGGTKVLNEDGDIATQVSVNQAAGFSIVGYTGTGNSTSTIGHGITAGAPDLIICKNSSSSGTSWPVYSSALPSVANNLFLDFSGFTNQYQDRFSAVTSTTFTAGSSSAEVNGNNDAMIAYCWKSVPGYSKIGSYTWTATSYTAGPMVANLGFTPRFVMIKGTTVTSNWYIFDNMRGQTGTYVYQNPLAPDLSDAEVATGYQSIQFNSNGFSAMVWNAGGATTGSSGLNQINETYLYFAVA